jgi:UDP-N-acetylglucosamine 3-dehydrogenase
VGSMGQNHARVYSEIADLVGVLDLDPVTGKQVARRLGTTYYDDLDMFLGEVEAISVCTPTERHFEAAREAIERGVHVLLEKPFTGSSDVARDLCLLAEERGVVLAAGFVERCNPVVSAAKDALREGMFGQAISIGSRRVSSWPSRVRDVGVIMDLAIHDIDVMRYITSAQVTSVYALGGSFSHPLYEDYIDLFMEMDSGVICFVEANWLTPMKVRRVSLTCSEGFVELDYIDQSLVICSTRFREIDPADMFHVPLEEEVRRISVRKEEPLMRELGSFLSAVEGKGGPMADGWEAVANLRVCEAALRSLRQKGRVELPAVDI